MADLPKAVKPMKAAKPAKIKDPFLDQFAVESDARLFRFGGIFALIGVGLITYLMVTVVVIPTQLLIHERKEVDTRVTVKLEDKTKPDHPDKDVPKTHETEGPPRGRGIQKAPVTQAALKMITSKSFSTSLSSYTLLGSKFTKDMDKVLGSVSGLTKTGQTRVGARAGLTNAGFNAGVASGGSGGVDNLLNGLWGGGGSGLNLQAKGGAGLRAPTASEVDMGEASGERSTESIVSVIRSHVPGLRHTFEKYLQMQPGFKGKISFRFTIAPSGDIIELTIVSSTTGSDAFDEEIRDKVKSWRFEPIKGTANDVITIAFPFSE